MFSIFFSIQNEGLLRRHKACIRVTQMSYERYLVGMGMMGRFLRLNRRSQPSRGRKSLWLGWARYLPSVLLITALPFAIFPFLQMTPYQNHYWATGLCFIYLAWLTANLNQNTSSIDRDRQQKVRWGSGFVMLVFLFSLGYFESQRPKYQVALPGQIFYQVPPQLSLKQLRELGQDCNTYGNTLCSHDVFAHIVKSDPRDYRSLANLAMAQTHLGFHSLAIHNFVIAIKGGIKTYDSLRFYGESLQKTGQLKRAIQAYKASLEKNPKQTRLLERIRKLEKASTKKKNQANITTSD